MNLTLFSLYTLHITVKEPPVLGFLLVFNEYPAYKINYQYEMGWVKYNLLLQAIVTQFWIHHDFLECYFISIIIYKNPKKLRKKV